MDFTAKRDRIVQRLRSIDPLLADIALAVGLMLLVWLQIWAIGHLRPAGFPVPEGARIVRVVRYVGPLPYLIIAAVFLPLSLRRVVPWLAFVLSGVAAAVYSVGHFPPSITILGPMIAIYSLAAYTRRRNALIALMFVVLVVAVPVLAFSGNVPRVAETAGTFALLTTAALLGDTARNRREYIAEVEARALEAERTRDEVALRRVEEERVRIARDVHDIVAHSLSIVTVQAAAAEAVLDRDPEQARESIRNIRATGREALGQLRSMLDVLRAADSDQTGPLSPAADLSHLEQLVTGVRDAGLEVDLYTEGPLAYVPAYASVSAYRIVQEALTNAVRHAKATRVTVRVSAGERDLQLLVQDDGEGATALPAAASSDASGHGIRGMRERVEALGGTFFAGNSATGGFQVTASIPLRGTAA